MIIPDLNLLIYAYNEGARLHDPAKRWWEDLLNGAETVGVPWVVSTGFIRLMTNPRVLVRPVTPVQAVNYVREWFMLPHVTPINPGMEHLTYLQKNLATVGVGGDLVTDSHVAALAMEHQAEVHTHDTDFRCFPGLRWRNPLSQG